MYKNVDEVIAPNYYRVGATLIIDEYGSKKIGKGAFADTKIEELVIAGEIEVIGEDAFRSCGQLKNVKLPSSLKRIEEDAFCNDDNLESIIIPEGVTYIGEGAFRQCKQLKNVFLPSSLEEIDGRIFEDCENLDNVILPDNIKTIPFQMFKGCKKLKSLKYSDNLELVEDCAFEDCESLEYLTLSSKVAFNGADIRGVHSSRIIIGCKSLKEFALPSGATYIRDYDFCDTDNLKKISLPPTVQKILSAAFPNPISLEQIELPFEIKSIAQDALGTNNIKRIVLYYYDEEEKKKEIEIDINGCHSITKHQDRFVVVDKDKEEIITADKSSLSRLSVSELLKITNTNDLNELKYKYSSISRSGIYHILPLWGSMKKKSGLSDSAELPPDFVMATIPSNEEDIKRYYQRHKVFEEILKASEFYSSEHQANLLKLCYAVGLFSGNIEESKNAFDYIKKHLEDGTLTGDYVRSAYDKFDLSVGYNPKFAQFYMQYFPENSNLLEKTSARIYNEFKKILKEFKKSDGIPLDLNFALQYLLDHKYNVRFGNEMLAKEVSKYGEVYGTSEFEQLQDLFEKAKKIAKRQAKKIMDTVDVHNGYTYFWATGDNPINTILGNEVKCCAKLGGAGQGIMEASMFDASVRNLIIYNKNKQIIGKATAYFNVKKRYILFNNIEMTRAFISRVKSAGEAEAFEAVLRAVQDQVQILNSDLTRPKVTKVAMGMRFNDLENTIIESGLPIVREERKMLENYHFTSSNGNAYAGDATDPEYGQVILWEYEKKNERTK